jgi:hypothetical protein
MGFNKKAEKLTLTAKLTPLGRRKLVSTNNSLITSFGLGDSDANYNAVKPLSSGEVPTEGGDIGVGKTASNSTSSNVIIKSSLIVNGNGIVRKLVDPQSSTITTENISNGYVTVGGDNLKSFLINRDDFATDSLVNLFYSFGLSLDKTGDNKFTNVLSSNGGYADTAMNNLAQSKILVLAINNTEFGETIDGKSVKITIPTTAGDYTLYSTYQKNGTALINQDANVRDTALATNEFGDNIAFLFSDDIQTPNGAGLSWGTGYGSEKPFSLNNKQLFNIQSNDNIGVTADKIVGIVYLDKGMVVITDPLIVNDRTEKPISQITVGFNSISTAIYQNITCIASRGEFGTSTNSTFRSTDTPRISEVCLYDNTGNIIAIAKTDRHITKNVNEFLALGIKISL